MKTKQPALSFLGATRFGMLLFVSEAPPRALQRKDGRRWVRVGLFRCDCGSEAAIDLRNVKRGRTRSCGCHMGRPYKDLALHGPEAAPEAETEAYRGHT